MEYGIGLMQISVDKRDRDLILLALRTMAADKYAKAVRAQKYQPNNAVDLAKEADAYTELANAIHSQATGKAVI